MTDLDFDDYYDGELALRPFLRAYARDRWSRLRYAATSFVKYSVLRWPRPVVPPMPPSRAATLFAVAEICKRQYGTSTAEDLATRPGGAFAALTKRVREAQEREYGDAAVAEMLLAGGIKPVDMKPAGLTSPIAMQVQAEQVLRVSCQCGRSVRIDAPAWPQILCPACLRDMTAEVRAALAARP